jgi:hypothetical protein
MLTHPNGLKSNPGRVAMGFTIARLKDNAQGGHGRFLGQSRFLLRTLLGLDVGTGAHPGHAFSQIAHYPHATNQKAAVVAAAVS